MIKKLRSFDPDFCDFARGLLGEEYDQLRRDYGHIVASEIIAERVKEEQEMQK